jgi:hypothetical protein
MVADENSWVIFSSVPVVADENSWAVFSSGCKQAGEK